ncbi:adenylate/guanylate cyclase domain-containing protein [Caenispirillum salinarum]|uniref:adenylate/guanylate cyclase domain-containing protein n=1 Tax=Caenispirillum salinarum TaxID=859058 RepID=UPI00068CBC14|nr:adenylate/guanylate cyclase domain-containing protein [Caenispirillum salinarum]
MTATPDEAGLTPVDAPFPLQRRYRRRILPGLLLFVLSLAVLATLGGRRMVESIYLDQAQARADSIAGLIAQETPEGWAALVGGVPLDRLWGGSLGAEVRKAFEEALTDSRLQRLKVYRPDRTIAFSTTATEIGGIDDGDTLAGLLADGDPRVVEKQTPDGGLYELYVPHHGPEERLLAVFELYEPQAFLDEIMLRTLAPAVVVPVLLLAGLVVLLGRLVTHAQADIDSRTARLVELRRRLESFVSRSAVHAARSAEEGSGHRLRMTLLYSDVRDFSGFSEDATPEAVVAFLNRLMALQVEAVRDRGGDVDKMIGDALLARFDGPAAAARAVAAAEDIQRAMAGASNLPRGVGIGIFTGDLVSGAIGPAERRDFTVIGDTVNVAARLCSAAAEGAVVVDAGTLATIGGAAADAFEPPEILGVKGRREPVTVRRRSYPAARAPSVPALAPAASPSSSC